MITHYRNKSAGSWKISLAVPMTPTTLTCGGGRLTTRTHREHVKWFYLLNPAILPFFLPHKDDHDPYSSTSCSRPVGLIVSLAITLRCAVKRVYV